MTLTGGDESLIVYISYPHPDTLTDICWRGQSTRDSLNYTTMVIINCGQVRKKMNRANNCQVCKRKKKTGLRRLNKATSLTISKKFCKMFHEKRVLVWQIIFTKNKSSKIKRWT